MSLVNEMLQDLQERQAADARPLAGLRAVPDGDMAEPAAQGRVGIWISAGLAVAAGIVAAVWLRTNSPQPSPAVAALPADYVAAPAAHRDLAAETAGAVADVIAEPAAPEVVISTPAPNDKVEAGAALPEPAAVEAVAAGPVAVVASTAPVVAAVPEQHVMPPREKRTSSKAAAELEGDAVDAAITKVAVAPQTRLRSDGLAAMRAGRRAEAEEQFRQLVALDPADTAAHLLLHAALTAQSRTVAGRNVLHAALDTAARPEAVAQVLARELLAENEAAQAMAVLEQHRPDSFGDLEYEATLAAVYQRAGRHADAVQVYRELVRRSPGQGAWWVGLAISQEAGGDRNGARESYATAVSGGDLNATLARYAGRRLAQLEGDS